MRRLKSSGMAAVVKSESDDTPAIANVLWVVVVFLTASPLVFVFLLLSPIGLLKMEIDVESSESGISQMFFAEEVFEFSEQRSQSQRVVEGPNQLAFGANPTRETLGSTLRWDPLDEPAIMRIASLEVRGFLVGEKYEAAEVLRPSLDVSEVLTDGSVAMIQTLSDDGQVIVDIDMESLYRGHILTIIATSLITGLVASLLGVRVWLVGQRSRLRFMPVGLDWRVFVVVVLGTSIMISLTWALVAR